MRQQKNRQTGIQPIQSGLKVGVSGAKVIDSSHCESTLSGANDLMGIDQKRDAVLRENGLDLTQFPVPVLMITQCGKSTVWSADPCHLLYAAREKIHRVRDIVSGEDKEIGLERNDLIG
jgi:hypothetical protein